MKSSPFYAWLARLRLIRRWGLMHSSVPENDAEHSLQTAMLAHGLAMLSRDQYHREVDPERVMALAVYHDAGEVFTGDLPTPVKHHDKAIHGAYAKMEQEALTRLLYTLPEEMRESYRPWLKPDESSLEWKLVKAADRISAWSRCAEEVRCGNREFARAAENILESIRQNPLPEVREFMDCFGDAFSRSLDELEEME